MQSSARHSSVPAAARGWRPQRTQGACCWLGCNAPSWEGTDHELWGSPAPNPLLAQPPPCPFPPKGLPQRHQPLPHCLPVVGGKRHVCAIVEEDSNAAVGELVAKAILVGVIHPLAHPDKVLMAGEGSWVFLHWWRGEGVSRAGSQPLPTSPPQRGADPLQRALAAFNVHQRAAMPSSHREGDAQHPVPSQSSPTGLPGGMEERQVCRSRTADSIMAEAVMQSSKAAERR